jgi:LysW-gamma-L-lysine carboxypeptidase
MTQDVNGPVEEGVDLLEGLLQIPSPSGSEGAAVDHLVAWMRRRGFVARRDEAGNAVGVLHPPRSDQTGSETRELVLLGHIDTVAGYPPVVRRDGQLYGRGAVDAKGPLAAFATAAALVGARPGWRIVVVGAVEEESATSKGARAVTRTLRPEMVIIGEPTGWQKVALGYKGRLLAELSVGRPMSHRAGPEASAPERALTYWSSVTGRLAQLNAGREKIWDQVQGMLRGFSSSDDGLEETAQLQLGFRLPLHMTPEELKEHLRDLVNGHKLAFHGEETAFRAEKNTPLVRAFLGAVRDQGGDPGFVVKTGTSDMNVVGPVWKCPIVAYGPGDSALDHTPEEHVELAEWRKGVAVLADVLGRATRCGQD